MKFSQNFFGSLQVHTRYCTWHFTGWPKKMCTHENFNCDFDWKAIYFKLQPHIIQFIWKTIHQSFNYFCRFLVNLWLSQDVFQMATISLQANLYSSGKVVNHFYTFLSRDGSYFCCDGSFQFFNCLWISLVYIVFQETPSDKNLGG